MTTSLLRRVPDVTEWPLHRSGELAGRPPLAGFCTSMIIPMIICDVLEQRAWAEMLGPAKPRTWCAVLFADKGGYPIRTLYAGRPLLNIPSEAARVQKSSGLAAEKAMRLGRKSILDGDVCSSQSAVETKEEYGGAVLMPNPDEGMISVSAFPGGLMDEAAVYLAGMVTRTMPEEWVRERLALTRNTAMAELARGARDPETLKLLGSYRLPMVIGPGLELLKEFED